MGSFKSEFKLHKLQPYKSCVKLYLGSASSSSNLMKFCRELTCWAHADIYRINTPFQYFLLSSFSFLEEIAVYSVYIIFVSHNLLLFHHCRVGNCSVINSALFPIYMNVYDPASHKISNSWLPGSSSFCHCRIER